MEFIAQYLVLRVFPTHPQILTTGTGAVLKSAVALGALAPGPGATLIDAHHLYTSVVQMMRLTVGEEFDPQHGARGVLRRIAAAAEVPDFARLDLQLRDMRKTIRTIFNSLLGP